MVNLSYPILKELIVRGANLNLIRHFFKCVVTFFSLSMGNESGSRLDTLDKKRRERKKEREKKQVH